MIKISITLIIIILKRIQVDMKGRHLVPGVQTGNILTEVFMKHTDVKRMENMLGEGMIMEGMARVSLDNSIMVGQATTNRKVTLCTTMVPVMSMTYQYIMHTRCYPQTARGEWGVPPSTSYLPTPILCKICK